MLGKSGSVEIQASVEVDLVCGLGIEPLDVAHCLQDRFCGDQICFLDEFEDRILGPSFVLETGSLEGTFAFVAGNRMR